MNTVKGKKTGWGFNPKTIDSSVRPQDDFFLFANGGWIKKTKLPSDESRWGSFIMLRHKTDYQQHTLLNELLKASRIKEGPEKLVRDLYRSAVDMPLRNKLDTTPIIKWQRVVEDISNTKDLLNYITKAHRVGISALWNSSVDQDSKKSDSYILHLYQGGLGMPERDYYLKNEAEQKRVRGAYLAHIDALLKLHGKTAEERAHISRVVLEIETRLARASMNKEDTRDVEKTYNKMNLSSLGYLSPSINWKHYFKNSGIKNVSTVIVATPNFFKEISRMLETISIDDWKTYFSWHLINDTASLLSEKFVKENFAFYGTVLSGAKKMKPLWRRALGTVNGTIGEALGKLYVERYFPQSAKKRMYALVSDLFIVYEDRIRALDWMSAQTKKKAILKLRKMNRKIGYPKRFRTYRGLKVDPTDYFGNIIRAHEQAHNREVRKLSRPVDRKEWFMTPQTVNAYCSFNLNEIVFPAAILQAPFFDENADDAINYAGIGAVIGHEMTHGFDDQGSKFDGNGNMKSWWTKKDEKQFAKRASLIAKQFDQYEAAAGVQVNGKLTLGENIADLGGLSIAYDAYQKRLRVTGRKNIDGLTPEQRFFLGFAQAEREIARPEFLKMAALTDPHSPAPCRVNGPVSNFEEFYSAFKVQKEDALYRPKNKRAKVW
ncbi:MAG: putative metalloendopeptidase [Parcubacteria group bacterium Greene0714_7]|nr:MAG: putative metalloendopeptidase [Parcubacteria group bacterium Greene0714_7]